MDINTIDFLADVRYLTKEQYLKEISNLRKEWKNVYSKLSEDIRAMKLGEKIIGLEAISWRACEINDLERIFTKETAAGIEHLPENVKEMDEYKNEIIHFAKKAGCFQSIRSAFSKQATIMLEQYMEQKSYLKKCAHYSFVMDRLMEDSNRRFV